MFDLPGKSIQPIRISFGRRQKLTARLQPKTAYHAYWVVPAASTMLVAKPASCRPMRS